MSPAMQPVTKVWLSQIEAAEYAGVSHALLKKWMKAGLKSYRPNGSRRRLLNREDIDRYMRGGK